MTDHDMDDFFDLLDDVYDLMGKTPAAKIISAGAKTMFFRALEGFSMAEVRAGLDAHAREGTFTPVPNDIRAQIEKRSPVHWIGADEAFARVSFDDSQPCLLNQVTAQALAVADPFMQGRRPDMNAARMAFRACYDRLVPQELLAGRRPLYFVSAGGSPEARAALQAEAARLGFLNVQGKPFSLPAPAAAPLLGHSAPPPHIRAALAQYKPKIIGAALGGNDE